MHSVEWSLASVCVFLSILQPSSLAELFTLCVVLHLQTLVKYMPRWWTNITTWYARVMEGTTKRSSSHNQTSTRPPSRKRSVEITVYMTPYLYETFTLIFMHTTLPLQGCSVVHIGRNTSSHMSFPHSPAGGSLHDVPHQWCVLGTWYSPAAHTRPSQAAAPATRGLRRAQV